MIYYTGLKNLSILKKIKVMIIHKQSYKIYGLICAGLLFMLFWGKLQAQTITPGGVNMISSGYALDLWVSGDNSTNTSWNNLAPANYTLAKVSANTPVDRKSVV
jgi:hypothetical protein